MEVVLADSNSLPDGFEIRHALDVLFVALDERLPCLLDLLLEVLDAPADFSRVEEIFRNLVNIVDLLLIFLSNECLTDS